MFLTGLSTVVTGFTAKEAISKYSPTGSLVTEMTLGVGNGSEKYPLTWVKVPVWDDLAQEALDVIDKKGIAVEASGMLQIRLYEGKRGKAVAIELKNVRELKIYDRDGNLKKVLPSVQKEEMKKEIDAGH
jgi:single-stranded DNA-binding protein